MGDDVIDLVKKVDKATPEVVRLSEGNLFLYSFTKGEGTHAWI